MISRDLSRCIQLKQEEISKVFGDFQTKSQLHCPPGCGQCCFNPEISCAPFELLPMAFHLLDQGLAESVLDKALDWKEGLCLLFEVSDVEKKIGRCGQYHHRPFVCRAFGVSARHGKKGTEFSVCRVLKENTKDFLNSQFNEDEIPFIETWKKQLETLDPKLLEKQIPIKDALVIILEKVLLWDSLQNATAKSPE